ncbi:MAG: hypothetical protein EKK64_04890 [Neisseriaceae bacterium]|nr:MAG: hypothetical protein EKK64_04890 [Neisseriaceae bacterium]
MRILFHKEIKATKKSLSPYLMVKWDNKILANKYGKICLESKPCTRTIKINDYRSGSKFYRLSFPYIQYLINYTVSEENGSLTYHYHGLDQHGLVLFYSQSPLDDIKQNVFLPFLDAYNLGLICTPHQYDAGVRFKTLKELIDFSISTYWGMTQYQNSEVLEEWNNKTIEDLLNTEILKKIEETALKDHYPNDLKSSFFDRTDRLQCRNANYQVYYRPKINIKTKIFKNKLLKNFKK